ncbi:MAG: NUDIX domain-containing protein [Candidatus Aenigmatarchaeota archaeon]
MPEKLGEKEIFKTKLFTVKDINLKFGKKHVTYQIVEKRDTAPAVPVQDGKLFLIKEYFTAINETQISLPKGRIENGEDEVETVNKELQEEINYKASKLDKLAVLTMSPGYLTQKTHVFLARNLTKSKQKGDEEEKPKLFVCNFNDFEKLIKNGELTEARAIAALYLAKNFMKNENSGIKRKNNC